MRHLLLLIYLLSLCCGMLLISQVVQGYRTFRQKQLRTYAMHLACLNLMALADAALVYVTLNISHEKGIIMGTMFFPWMLFSALLFCAMVGYVATFMVLVVELSGKKALLKGKWPGVAGLAAALAILAAGLFQIDFLMQVIHYLDHIVRALILILSVSVFVTAQSIGGSGRRIALRSFTAFQATVNLLFFLFYGFKGLFPWLFTFYTVFYFLILNLVPLLFLGKFLHYFHGRKLFVFRSKPDMDSTLSGYGISRREREIIQLVCAGKSNHEIEELLFISLKTVKFHLYNIYRKLGIRNRIELMNLVQTALNESARLEA